ncbi:MAG TPA: GNAT family N-acetyltransferase [Candidatus Koribacter sp.]|jgi:RimJ/RimL family protein N-acetyltransferase
MYFLATQRLKFRHWTADDLPLALQLWGDSRVTEHLGGDFTPAGTAARLNSEIAQQQAHAVQYWPIFTLDDSQFIGVCGLRPYRDILELGYHLRPDFWGKGIASEAARAAIKYGFYALEVPALFAGHYPENLVSKHVLEKLGFRYTHDEFYPPAGRINPSYLLRKPVRA